MAKTCSPLKGALLRARRNEFCMIRDRVRLQHRHRVSGGKLRFPMVMWHSSLATLFVGMIAVLLRLAQADQVDRIGPTMGVVLGVATVLSLAALGGFGTSKMRMPGVVTVFIVLITLAGIPGLVLNPSDAMNASILFVLALGIRNYVCFFSIPLSRAAVTCAAERVIISWCLAAIGVVAFGSLALAVRTGVSLGDSGRLTSVEGDLWVNANVTGLYCAYGALMAVMAKFIPLWIRFPVGMVASYCLILSQSRTSMAALIISVIVHFAVVRAGRRLARAGMVVVALVLLLASWDYVAPSITSVPKFAEILRRLQATDPRQQNRNDMRRDIIESGLDMWSQSPVVGFGYAAEQTRFENGYLSLACETGVIGLGLYLAFVLLVLKRGTRLLNTSENSRTHEIGVYLVCTTVFIFVHSLGERSHGFGVGSPISNCWAMLAAVAFTVRSAASTLVLPQTGDAERLGTQQMLRSECRLIRSVSSKMLLCGSAGRSIVKEVNCPPAK